MAAKPSSAAASAASGRGLVLQGSVALAAQNQRLEARVHHLESALQAANQRADQASRPKLEPVEAARRKWGNGKAGSKARGKGVGGNSRQPPGIIGLSPSHAASRTAPYKGKGGSKRGWPTDRKRCGKGGSKDGGREGGKAARRQGGKGFGKKGSKGCDEPPPPRERSGAASSAASVKRTQTTCGEAQHLLKPVASRQEPMLHVVPPALRAASAAAIRRPESATSDSLLLDQQIEDEPPPQRLPWMRPGMKRRKEDREKEATTTEEKGKSSDFYVEPRSKKMPRPKAADVLRGPRRSSPAAATTKKKKKKPKITELVIVSDDEEDSRQQGAIQAGAVAPGCNETAQEEEAETASQQLLQEEGQAATASQQMDEDLEAEAESQPTDEEGSDPWADEDDSLCGSARQEGGAPDSHEAVDASKEDATIDSRALDTAAAAREADEDEEEEDDEAEEEEALADVTSLDAHSEVCAFVLRQLGIGDVAERMSLALGDELALAAQLLTAETARQEPEKRQRIGMVCSVLQAAERHFAGSLRDFTMPEFAEDPWIQRFCWLTLVKLSAMVPPAGAA
eukprot:TRINITY_DN20576_c0_g1_i1.p1 TRINITY_DN20576_c0_g1~~TRINITY_DN20576_c0_g1_i1.p1  ORF type:complete len:568 (+),score=188.52 TRINITY_DN20576_c0_g1_i1:91-1794(+)